MGIPCKMTVAYKNIVAYGEFFKRTNHLRIKAGSRVAGGRVLTQDETYATPGRAGLVVCGNATCNGWGTWIDFDNQPLKVHRDVSVVSRKRVLPLELEPGFKDDVLTEPEEEHVDWGANGLTPVPFVSTTKPALTDDELEELRALEGLGKEAKASILFNQKQTGVLDIIKGLGHLGAELTMLREVMEKAHNDAVVGVSGMTCVMRRPYRNNVLEFTEKDYEELIPKSAHGDTVLPRIFDLAIERMKSAVREQPVLILGQAGVGKDVAQAQMVADLAKESIEKSGAFYLSRINFTESTMISQVGLFNSITTQDTVIGEFVECVMLANELYFDEDDTSSPAPYVVCCWNELTRNDGSAYRGLYDFLSARGTYLVIDGQKYYNTPNLMLVCNGNTATSAMRVDMTALDAAFRSRCYIEEFNGVLDTRFDNGKGLDTLIEFYGLDEDRAKFLRGLADKFSSILSERSSKSRTPIDDGYYLDLRRIGSQTNREGYLTSLEQLLG